MAENFILITLTFRAVSRLTLTGIDECFQKFLIM